MAVIAVLFYAPLYLSATMTGLRLIPQAGRGAAGSLGLGYPDARGRSLPLLQICVHFLACSGFLTNYHVHPHDPFLASVSLFLHFWSGLWRHAHRDTCGIDFCGRAQAPSRCSISFIRIPELGKLDKLWSRFGDREGAIEIIQKIRNSLDYINKGASGLGILEY
ncbi:hypothetical protein GX48_05100 [Paracoccidioides brasiliensis]|nr:hypothetical protein GX48_05100 [Paracoccidioides brasiliensis]